MRLDDAAADREAEARAALRVPASGRGRTSRRSRASSPGGKPGPAVGDLDARPRASLGGGRDLDRARPGVYLTALSSRLIEHLLDQHGIERHERQVGRERRSSTRRSPRRCSSARQRGADHLLERHATPCGTRMPPDSRRVMSSRLCDQAVQALGLLVDRLRAARAVRRDRAATRRSASALAAPVIAASGVRRSCETARQQRVAQLLRLGPAAAPAGRPRRARRARARARSGARRSRASWRCSGVASAVARRRLEAEHADGAARRARAAGRAPARRAACRAAAGRLAVLEAPTARRRARSRRRSPSASSPRTRGRARPSGPGRSTATWRPEHLRDVARRRAAAASSSRCCWRGRGSARRGAAVRRSRWRAASACARMRAVSVLITTRDEQHHGERDQVLACRRPRRCR